MYNTCRAPVLYNYAHAKDWHDKTPPIRGNKDKVRPLGSRRHWSMASIAMDGDDVVLNYYGSKCVVWHPDDSLTIHYPRWCTAFEPEKLAHFLPPKLHFEWNQRRFIVFNDWDKTRVELRHGGTVRLNAVGVDPWNGRVVRKFQFAEIPETAQYAKRRGVSTRILREKFIPFLEWVRVVTAISPNVTDAEAETARDALFFQATHITEREWEIAEHWYGSTPWSENESVATRKQGFNHDQHLRRVFPMRGQNGYAKDAGIHMAGARALYNMMLLENQDQWLNALQIIAGHQGYNRWVNRETHFEIRDWQVQKYLERLVCAVHRDDVFKRVQLEAGEIPTKRHTEFFREVEFRYFENTDTVSDISV